MLLFLCRVQDVIQYMRQPLLSALEDRSSYVRRHAVMAANKLFKSSPQDFEGFQTSCINENLKTSLKNAVDNFMVLEISISRFLRLVFVGLCPYRAEFLGLITVRIFFTFCGKTKQI